MWCAGERASRSSPPFDLQFGFRLRFRLVGEAPRLGRGAVKHLQRADVLAASWFVAGAPAAQSELRVCFLSNYAETITEWIAAKRDRRVFSAFEFLFAFRASVQHLDQDTLKIVNVEIDVNRRPVSLISTNVVRPLRRFGSCPFLNQTDLGAATFENDIRRDRSGDFDKAQRATIKS
jgi:hypothetical protein